MSYKENFRIKRTDLADGIIRLYHVQFKVLGCWFTLRTFQATHRDDDYEYAEGRAEELLYYLKQEE